MDGNPLTSYTRLHALHGQVNVHAHRAHVGVFAKGVDVGTRRCEIVVVVVGMEFLGSKFRESCIPSA